MSFFDWFIDPVKNHYVDFEGRATRKQFWMFVLVSLVLTIGIGVVEEVINTMIFGTLFSLAVLLPNIAIATRRLHDIDRSGWWQLIAFIPLIGIIVLIVWLAEKSKDEGNRYASVTDVSPEVTPAPPVAPAG